VTGSVCLQGGGEFSAGCRPMDADLLRRAPGRVAVSALAGAVGRDYASATANGVGHYRALGAPDVVAAPDARQDEPGAVAALRGARLVVLPGGSPSRLLHALRTTAVGDLLRTLLSDGVLLMGSSAGAMVLCPWTVLPDDQDGPSARPGLGLVADLLVVPHWAGAAGRGDWLAAAGSSAPAGTEVLGIPEESGVLVEGSVLTALGRAATTLVTTGRSLEPGEQWDVRQSGEDAR